MYDTILYGLYILLLTFSIRFTIQLIFPSFIHTLYSFLPIKVPFLGTSLFTFIFTIIIVFIINIYKKDFKNEIDNAIKSVGNELELLLRSSFNDSKLLQFTLDTRKVYVVWVKELPMPSITNYIRVIPAMSGYRNENNELIFTTDYLKVYSKYIENGEVKSIDELNVDLIITLDNVVTVSYFDIEMYGKFN